MMSTTIRLAPGGEVTVGRRTIFFDLYPDRLNDAGWAALRAWVEELFHDAEKVRRLSKRTKMWASGSNGCHETCFARAYAKAEVDAWARKLVAILDDPGYRKRRRPLPEDREEDPDHTVSVGQAAGDQPLLA